MAKTNPHGLNDREHKFALEYCQDFHGTNAAIRAGYATSGAHVQASRLLRKPKVLAIIAEHGQQTADELGITRGYILAQLNEVVRKAMLGAPKTNAKGEQVYDDEGHPIVEWNAAGVNKALELLMRQRGDLIERSEVKVSGVSVTINGVDPEDLR